MTSRLRRVRASESIVVVFLFIRLANFMPLHSSAAFLPSSTEDDRKYDRPSSASGSAVVGPRVSVFGGREMRRENGKKGAN